MLAALLAAAPAAAQRDLAGTPKIKLALERLNVLGSVLMIAAHPDDENTALLAYLARGRHLRTVYLSLTRGEGGQNLIGPERGDLMGVIRTQELLAARRIDGAEQYFTRAIDFGYSKTAAETLAKWGRREVLGPEPAGTVMAITRPPRSWARKPSGRLRIRSSSRSNCAGCSRGRPDGSCGMCSLSAAAG